jgi:preprotein translocase subunit SecG
VILSYGPFTILLFLNSFALLALILNQNESKENSANQASRSFLNPLEKFTWIFLSFQFILLLINLKITDN